MEKEKSVGCCVEARPRARGRKRMLRAFVSATEREKEERKGRPWVPTTSWPGTKGGREKENEKLISLVRILAQPSILAEKKNKKKNDPAPLVPRSTRGGGKPSSRRDADDAVFGGKGGKGNPTPVPIGYPLGRFRKEKKREEGDNRWRASLTSAAPISQKKKKKKKVAPSQ